MVVVRGSSLAELSCWHVSSFQTVRQELTLHSGSKSAAFQPYAYGQKILSQTLLDLPNRPTDLPAGDLRPTCHGGLSVLLSAIADLEQQLVLKFVGQAFVLES